MNLHHALRIRLLAQRASAPGVISPSNCGMLAHALRQLDVFNVGNVEFLRHLGNAYPQANIRSRSNVFHCLSCCVREQKCVHEGLSEALHSLLVEMQENILSSVDDLSPTECILVMEGLVKLMPYCCVTPQLMAIVRNRSTALVDVVSGSLELIGIARSVVEAMQESQPCCPDYVEDEVDHSLLIGWSEELREISRGIESRLDHFSKQDMLTLLDALTFRVAPSAKRSSESSGVQLSERQKTGKGAFRDVPDECRSLVLRVLDRVRQLITGLSSSQVSAWLFRVVSLRLQHHPLFVELLHRIDEDRVRDAMSLSQLSTSIESLGRELCRRTGEDYMTDAERQLVARVVVKLLDSLVSALERGSCSRSDCSTYLLPVLLLLSEEVAAGRLDITRRLIERSFCIPYNHLGALSPRERAEVTATVFLWGVLKRTPTQWRQRRERKDTDSVSSLAAWCDAVLAHINSYNALDALHIINEVSAAVYAEAAGDDLYDSSIVRPMLERLHRYVQEMQDTLVSVPSSHLVRYLASMSKMGVRRKTEFYVVLNVIQQRELNDFEHIRVLGVVARHHLRALSFLSDTMKRISQYAVSLQPQQKCLVLKYLGQVRASRYVRAPCHPSLEFGTFLRREELLELPLLSALFAFVGLVELRQFENETIGFLLRGPLAHPADFSEILSATFLCGLVAALVRVDARLVPTSTVRAALDRAANRLLTSRSFFLDMAEISFWLRLMRDRPLLGSDTTDTKEETSMYIKAVSNYMSVAAAIASTRLRDIAESGTLRPNTFLFNQLAIAYRLGITLPAKTEARLSEHLDTKQLPQLLSNPRQVVNAVKTAMHMHSMNPNAAADVFRFARKNFSSLSVQEMLVLGIEVSESLRHTDSAPSSLSAVIQELHVLVKQNLVDTQRWKKMSTQEIAIGRRYGLMEGDEHSSDP